MSRQRARAAAAAAVPGSHEAMISRLIFFAVLTGNACVLCTASPQQAADQRSSLLLPSRPPPLPLVENTLLTTAKDDFAGSEDAYESAVSWHLERLQGAPQSRDTTTAAPCPFIACGPYSTAQEIISRLQSTLPPRAIRKLHLGKEHGVCLMLTMASIEAAAAISEDLPTHNLLSFAPFPSTLKLAPGLLEHNSDLAESRHGTARLATTHGENMRVGEVLGLTLQLSPGVLPAHHEDAGPFIDELLQYLMAESLDLHEINFWSASGTMSAGVSSGGDHGARPASVTVRAREWHRAAEVVHGLSGKGGDGGGAVARSPGDVCGWEHVSVHHAGADILFLTGRCGPSMIPGIRYFFQGLI